MEISAIGLGATDLAPIVEEFTFALERTIAGPEVFDRSPDTANIGGVAAARAPAGDPPLFLNEYAHVLVWQGKFFHFVDGVLRLPLRTLFCDPFVDIPHHPVFQIVSDREHDILLFIAGTDEAGIAAKCEGEFLTGVRDVGGLDVNSDLSSAVSAGAKSEVGVMILGRGFDYLQAHFFSGSDNQRTRVQLEYGAQHLGVAAQRIYQPIL